VNDVSPSRAVSPGSETTAAARQSAKAEAAGLLAALGAVQRVARRTVRDSAYAEPLPPAGSSRTAGRSG